jgi:hypothetical protein
MKKQLIATAIAKSGFVVGAQIGYAKANLDWKTATSADI